MGRLLAVIGCVCTLAALAHSAAVPTQDTMVVAKSDDTVSLEKIFSFHSLMQVIKLTPFERFTL